MEKYSLAVARLPHGGFPLLLISLLSFSGCSGCNAPQSVSRPADPKVVAQQEKRAEAEKVEKKEFEGKWEAVTCFLNGVPNRAGIGKIMTITPELMTMNDAKWYYYLIPDVEPKQINLAPEGATDWTEFGIYHFWDDKLTIHLSRKLRPRPTSFDPESGGQEFELTVYRRVKK